MFPLQNKILLVFLICFAGKIVFSQENKSSHKFEIYENDTINRITKDGQKIGKWIYFGKDRKEGGFNRGKNKQIADEGHYINNKKHHIWKSYYVTGKIKSEITYANGQPKGSVKLYYEDGTIKEDGMFENNQWTSEHYIYDHQGNKISNPPTILGAYLELSGTVSELYKVVEGAKITVIENHLEEKEYTTLKDGNFSIRLRLNQEFIINFTKPGYSTQSLIVHTAVYPFPETVYYLKDWKVRVSNDIASAATNELLGLLLDKPVNKIYFNRKKKQFDSDGKYEHFFKQQTKMIGKTGEAMLSMAMQENKRLEIENLKVEENNKGKEIELLKKNLEVQNAELSNKETELAKQKLEVEKKEQEQMLLDKDQKLKYQEQDAALMKHQLDEERKAYEIKQLTNAKKLQELELQVNKAKLNKTTFELNSTSTELQKQTAEAERNEKENIRLNFAKKVKEEELKDQQAFIQYIAAVMGIVIIFSLLLYRNFLGKKKANKILEQQAIEINFQKKVVDEKNKGITDSINYAKLIQEAILPAKEIKYKLFPEAFVLFLPKDIVSGDFYWFNKKNNKRLIATVDCTGHGVPGAFMSMIGNALLNEIINEKGITTPAEILNHLREKIITSLNQKDGENKDGMDISILCFDDQNNTVEFAGANNPLWLVSKGTIKEIKGDKQPIGLYHGTSQPFTNHTIELQKGDTLYIFTDGYADQFGGEHQVNNGQKKITRHTIEPDSSTNTTMQVKGKKFKYKQLQNVLLSIQDKPLLEQEKLLIEKMNHWKGDLEQVDDILIIGVRV